MWNLEWSAKPMKNEKNEELSMNKNKNYMRNYMVNYMAITC